MEQIQTTFSEEEIEDLIEHSGVKGMKWGVWNEETRRKYHGGLGRASNTMKAKLSHTKDLTAKGASVVGAFAKRSAASMISKASTMAANSKAKRQIKKTQRREAAEIEKAQKREAAEIKKAQKREAAEIKKAQKQEAAEIRKQQRREIREQRKELGMSKARYDKLRERTLKSHDPRVIERGMRTLTDRELNQKLDRLQREAMVSKLSTDLTTRKQAEASMRLKNLKANPLYQIGERYATGYLDAQLKRYLGKQAADDALKAQMKAARAAARAEADAASKVKTESNGGASAPQKSISIPGYKMPDVSPSPYDTYSKKYNFNKTANAMHDPAVKKEVNKIIATAAARKLTSGQSITKNKDKAYSPFANENRFDVNDTVKKVKLEGKPTKEQRAFDAKNSIEDVFKKKSK